MKRAQGRHGGVLIVIEGIDGSGKSTLQKKLAQRWRSLGYSVVLRREPNDRRLGLAAQRSAAHDPWTGATYFTLDRFFARAQLERSLESHDIVLMDRSFFSTLAYQGSALPRARRKLLASLQRQVTLTPDRVLLLDLPPSLALRRIRKRRGVPAPLEQRRTLTRVARAYRRFARRRDWIVLDARKGPEELVEGVVGRSAPWLRRRVGAGRR